MEQYVCKFCGYITATPMDGFCSRSPGGNHEFMEAKREYVCRYCGHKTNSVSGGPCSGSPHKNHEFT